MGFAFLHHLLQQIAPIHHGTHVICQRFDRESNAALYDDAKVNFVCANAIPTTSRTLLIDWDQSTEAIVVAFRVLKPLSMVLALAILRR